MKATLTINEAWKKYLEKLIDNIRSTTWYHINKNGEIVEGANDEHNEPLYKAKDILKIIDECEEELNESNTTD